MYYVRQVSKHKKESYIYLTLITLNLSKSGNFNLSKTWICQKQLSTTERIFVIKRKLQNNIITQFSQDKYVEIEIEIIRDNYFLCNSSSKSNRSLINTYSTRKIVH